MNELLTMDNRPGLTPEAATKLRAGLETHIANRSGIMLFGTTVEHNPDGVGVEMHVEQISPLEIFQVLNSIFAFLLEDPKVERRLGHDILELQRRIDEELGHETTTTLELPQ